MREELQHQSWTRGLLENGERGRNGKLHQTLGFGADCSADKRTRCNQMEVDSAWRVLAKRAYNIQFAGSHSQFVGASIWKAEAEGKHRFFAWLMVQSKLLTADNLIKRQWPCDPICSLYSQEQETADHLILQCCFAKEVWHLASLWTQDLVKMPTEGLSIAAWWEELAVLLKKLRRTKAITNDVHTAWNLWKDP